MKPYKIDPVSEKILLILEKNSKATDEEIAKQLGISAAVVTQSIKKLEKDHIILGYTTHINWQRIRQHDVKAIIEVKVIPEKNVGFNSVAETIYRFPEVSSVMLMSGGYDLLVQVDGDNLREVALFVAEKLATIKGVQSTVSHFLLKKYKEDGVIFEEQPDSKRMPLVP